MVYYDSRENYGTGEARGEFTLLSNAVKFKNEFTIQMTIEGKSGTMTVPLLLLKGK